MRPVLLLAAVALIAGCDVFPGTPEPERTRVPGVLVTGDASTPTIRVLDQIRVGVPVRITVMTQSLPCNEQGDTEVEFVDGAVEIRPYDVTVVYDPVRFCTAEEKPDFPHTVSVTFPDVGPLLVRAIGATYEGTPQVRELGIVVR